MVKKKEVNISFRRRIYLLLIWLVIVIIVIGGYYFIHNKFKNNDSLSNNVKKPSFISNIVSETEKNTYFRRVLFTGQKSQLVVMSIASGGEVGEDIHKYTEQTLFFLSGSGKAILDGKESLINAGDVVVVTPGTKHNFINTGSEPLKIYTVYAPPNHIDGRIHLTKEDADKDVADEAIGEVER